MSDVAPKYLVKDVQKALEFFSTRQHAEAVRIDIGHRAELVVTHADRDGVQTTITIFRVDEGAHAMLMPTITTTERFGVEKI